MEPNPNKFTTCLMPVQLLYMESYSALHVCFPSHDTWDTTMPQGCRLCHPALGGPCARVSAHRSHILTHHLSSALFPTEPAARDSDSIILRHLHKPISTQTQLGAPAWQLAAGQRRRLYRALTAR